MNKAIILLRKQPDGSLAFAGFFHLGNHEGEANFKKSISRDYPELISLQIESDDGIPAIHTAFSVKENL